VPIAVALPVGARQTLVGLRVCADIGNMRIECYGASLPQDGRHLVDNQDAFAIIRSPAATAVVCDGAGNAQLAARRVVGLLEHWLAEATLGQLLGEDVWVRWARLADSALLGGAQSTLVAASVIGAELRGTVVGDSRVYLLPSDGGCVLLSEGASKRRLGSGEIDPFVLRHRLAPRDVLLLLTDGAWTPLDSFRLERAVRSASLQHFSEVPSAILQLAGGRGRADDMTAVAVRLRANNQG
jgi:serine/threonine protein phosphatase PrpC